ncbi:MAG: serine hydroxymethyltransferase [Thermovirgaceae bacterium]|nr:serine hydroxymethyltransferase [Thermovirgaceae bacterium]
MNKLNAVDPEAAALVARELVRECTTIELIASENFVPECIMEAQGTILTNKYAEGYPGRRYHGGCEVIDEIESLAIERAKTLFSADHANVQPHSGVNANLAVYMALLEPGDTILGMDLRHGGHLSHGSKVSITGKYYRSFAYGVDEKTELIDYGQVAEAAKTHGPKLIVAGGSAYSRVIDFARFREIADSVGAFLMVDMAHIAGLVAAGIHPSPVPWADVVTSTTTKTLRGARGGFILCRREHAAAIDKAVFPGTQGGPILQNVLAKAVTFKIAATEGFRTYARQVQINARCMAETLGELGLRIVSGGTDNHLMLVDLRPWNQTGVAAESALGQVGITVNKNMIPFDPASPTIASGIRIGTAAVTARGFVKRDIERVAAIIGSVLQEKEGFDPGPYRAEVLCLCRDNPLYLTPLEYGAVTIPKIEN